MLLLLSPAKTLDYDTPVPPELAKMATTPAFAARAAELIEVLRRKTPVEVASLMRLSDPLAALNIARYAAWSNRITKGNSKPAVLAFAGDVYEGLDAASLGTDDLAWAQQHVLILSGLYGALRPLDKLQPYRLEMGTPLANAHGKDLYAFWGDAMAQYVNKTLARDAAPIVVNLASQEYAKAALRRALTARVIECVFEDWKDGRYKIISFFAKRARGLMARHVIRGRLVAPKGLEKFKADGYALEAAASEPDRLVFRRRR